MEKRDVEKALLFWENPAGLPEDLDNPSLEIGELRRDYQGHGGFYVGVRLVGDRRYREYNISDETIRKAVDLRSFRNIMPGVLLRANSGAPYFANESPSRAESPAGTKTATKTKPSFAQHGRRESGALRTLIAVAIGSAIFIGSSMAQSKQKEHAAPKFDYMQIIQKGTEEARERIVGQWFSEMNEEYLEYLEGRMFLDVCDYKEFRDRRLKREQTISTKDL